MGSPRGRFTLPLLVHRSARTPKQVRRKPWVERATCPSRRATSPPVSARPRGEKLWGMAMPDKGGTRRAGSPPTPAGSRCHPFLFRSSGSVNILSYGKGAPPPRLDGVSRRDGGGPIASFRFSAPVRDRAKLTALCLYAPSRVKRGAPPSAWFRLRHQTVWTLKRRKHRASWTSPRNSRERVSEFAVNVTGETKAALNKSNFEQPVCARRD